MMWWHLVACSCLSEVAPGDNGDIKSELPSMAPGADDADKAGQNVHDVVALGCIFLFV